MSLLAVGISHRTAPVALLEQFAMGRRRHGQGAARAGRQRPRQRGARAGHLQPGRGLRRGRALPRRRRRRQPGARPAGRRRPSRSSRRTSPSTTRTRPSRTCSPSPPGWTRWWSARRRSSASCAPPTRSPARRARSAARCTRSPSGRCGSASGCTPRPASTGPAPRWSRSRSTAREDAHRRPRRPPGRSSSAPARWARWPATTLARRGADVVVSSRTAATAERLADSIGGRAAALDRLDRGAGRRRRAGHLHRRDRPRRRTPTPSPRPSGRAGRPLVVLDLALPRDVDPAVAALPGVHVVDLALLQGERRRRRRSPGPSRPTTSPRPAPWSRPRRRCCAPSGRPPTVAPTVSALRSQAAEVVDAELLRLSARLPDLDARARGRGRPHRAPRRRQAAARADRAGEGTGRAARAAPTTPARCARCSAWASTPTSRTTPLARRAPSTVDPRAPGRPS